MLEGERKALNTPAAINITRRNPARVRTATFSFRLFSGARPAKFEAIIDLDAE
jgi:hypothetical protein